MEPGNDAYFARPPADRMTKTSRHNRTPSASSGWHVPESAKGVVFQASWLLCIVVASTYTSPAQAVTVTASATLAGKTPEIVGYNSGHFMPGSNTADWWRYSNVNGARVWPTPTVVEPSDDLSPWGDGVSSQTTFVARRD